MFCYVNVFKEILVIVQEEKQNKLKFTDIVVRFSKIYKFTYVQMNLDSYIWRSYNKFLSELSLLCYNSVTQHM